MTLSFKKLKRILTLAIDLPSSWFKLIIFQTRKLNSRSKKVTLTFKKK